MKIKSNKVVFFAVLMAILCCASVCFGQEDDEAGGYVNASVADAGVKAAAAFAVKEKSAGQSAAIRLVAIKSARTQVVAGVNYEMCLAVTVKGRDDDEASEEFIKTIVYRNLKNVFSLTSWAESDCADQ